MASESAYTPSQQGINSGILGLLWIKVGISGGSGG